MVPLADTGSHDPRERIAALLRDSRPEEEFAFPYATSFTPEQIEAFRKFLPATLSRAAVLVPLVDRPEGLNVLLTLRASHLKNHAGQISFPGGRMEASDAGPWEAALREAQEEIGLEPHYVSQVGYLRDHLVISGYRVTPVVGFVRPDFKLQLDRTEVDEVFEVPLDYVVDPAHHVPRERHFAGMSVTGYEIVYQGRTIWGATAGMLITFARLLQGAPP